MTLSDLTNVRDAPRIPGIFLRCSLSVCFGSQERNRNADASLFRAAILVRSIGASREMLCRHDPLALLHSDRLVSGDICEFFNFSAWPFDPHGLDFIF